MSGTVLVVYTGPDHATQIAQRELGDRFQLVRVEPSAASLLPRFRECTALLDASMKVPLTSEDIEQAEELRLIATATTGATHIDQAALARRDIPLLTLQGQTEVLRNLTPAAELSWALVMACARRLRGAIDHVKAARWERVEFPGLMLKGRTLGLIGMGRIGSWMARYAHAFDMQVCYFDPHVDYVPEYARRCSLEELVGQADVISIHVHVSDETRGMVDAGLISRFKRGAIFINTARAELVDEQALVAALDTGALGAVGADVLSGEPDIGSSALWQYACEHENVILTPHIGGYCPDAVDRVVAFSARRIREFLCPAR